MGGALNGVVRVLAYGTRLLPRRVQATTRIQLGDWCHSSDTHTFAFVHRLLASMGSARTLGRDRGYKHDGGPL